VPVLTDASHLVAAAPVAPEAATDPSERQAARGRGRGAPYLHHGTPGHARQHPGHPRCRPQACYCVTRVASLSQPNPPLLSLF
jgi:hypothetical protein